MDQAQHIDWTGLATFFTALGGFVAVVGTIIMQVLTFLRQGKQMAQSLANAQTLQEVKVATNGNTDKLLNIVEKHAEVTKEIAQTAIAAMPSLHNNPTLQSASEGHIITTTTTSLTAAREAVPEDNHKGL